MPQDDRDVGYRQRQVQTRARGPVINRLLWKEVNTPKEEVGTQRLTDDFEREIPYWVI